MTSTVQLQDVKPVSDPSTIALFQQQWTIYRKLVDNNFLFHQEAYDRLHRYLADEAPDGFRFLDIACGDASASVGALRGTSIGSYRGVDFSAAALDIARVTLGDLPCPVLLQQRDMLEAIEDGDDPVDIAWIGLSLHHLKAPEKAAFMARLRSGLSPAGALLIYENTMREDEERSGWMRRWDDQESAWTAYTPEEWTAMRSHVHAADHPETSLGWHELGKQAGFRSCRELFVAPSDLFRLYCFAR